MTIKCRCGATAVTNSPFVSGATDIGWQPLMGIDGALHYVCPQCLPKVKAAARLLADYSNEYVSIGSLLKESS